MAINKAVVNKKVSVMWNGIESAEIRGLVPNDIAEIMRLAGEKVTDVLVAVEEFEFVKDGDQSDLGDRIMRELPKAISKVSASVPEFVALIIAYAADDPDGWKHVRDEWNISLQFECLSQIAAATFVDDAGFRMFVGNVQALLASGSALTSVGGKPKAPTSRGRERSPRG